MFDTSKAALDSLYNESQALKEAVHLFGSFYRITGSEPLILAAQGKLVAEAGKPLGLMDVDVEIKVVPDDLPRRIDLAIMAIDQLQQLIDKPVVQFHLIDNALVVICCTLQGMLQGMLQ